MIRALQLNVNVFFASNSLRRNVATHSLNYRSTVSELRTIEKTLQTGSNLRITNDEMIAGFVLYTSSPVTLALTPRIGDPFPLTVRQFIFLDQDFAEIEIVAADNDTYVKVQVA
jgi:hypothetical protein